MNIVSFDKRTLATVFSASILAGLAAHSFPLTNTIYNYDSIFINPTGYGAGLHSGRWVLEFMEGFARKNDLLYQLPFMNGLVFLFLIAASATLAVSAFRVSSPAIAAFIGMLFSVFPSVTSTMLFSYTVIPYGISILAAILSVWILRQNKYGLPFAVFLMAFSMGIYQAYITLSISMLVLLLIQDAFRGDSTWYFLLKRGMYYCAAIALGTALYFLLLHYFLEKTGTQLIGYQGISNMGNISTEEIPALLLRTFWGFWLFPLNNYCGISHTFLLSVIYTLLGILAAGMSAVILIKKIRNFYIFSVILLLYLAFPIAVNFIGFMCPDGTIYTIMIFSFVFVPCLPLIIYEQLPREVSQTAFQMKRLLRNVLGILTALLIFLYAYYANANYVAMHFSNQQMSTYVTSIVTQVRSTDGFDIHKEWAMIGTPQDPSQDFWWQQGLIYGGTATPSTLMTMYSARDWFIHYAGYPYPEATPETILELSQNETVLKMPCWPNAGSIQIIGNYVVIKFDNLK